MRKREPVWFVQRSGRGAMKWIRRQKLSKADWNATRQLRARCELPGKRECKQLNDVIKGNPALKNEDEITQLCAMVTSMRKSRLKCSTIATTIRKIVGHKKFDWPHSSTKKAMRLAEEVEANDTDTTKPAIRVTRPQTTAIIKSLQNAALRAGVELLSNSPLRFCDIRATPFERTQVSKKFVEVKLQGGKTSKKRLTREKIRIKRKLLTPATLKFLEQGRQEAPKLAICAGSATTFNAQLKSLGIEATTYSFRNLWISEIIQKCTNSEGQTDWDKVQGITLHRSLKALKSNYGFSFDSAK